jgi:opacity protein-like surface antigen
MLKEQAKPGQVMKNMLGKMAVAIAVGTVAIATVAMADKAPSLSGTTSASVTYGPYVRLDIGSGRASFGDGYWLPPGYPADPRVNFGLQSHTTSVASIALGYDWMNGFRGDVGLIATGKSPVTGPWTSTDPVSPGPHGDITSGSVSTTALMGNVFYSPLEHQGVNTRINPFVVAGIGIANNAVGDWTRTNTSLLTGQVRTFAGETSTSVALSLGFGVAWQLTAPGEHPVILEVSYRYYDFGTAHGGSTPLNGSGTPVKALTFHNTNQVISVGIRIPLNKL